MTLEQSIFCLFSITHACQHFKSELALHILGMIKTNFQLFLPQEQVCGVWHEASVQEVLWEIPSRAEEEAEEVVWNCCTEVDTQISNCREGKINETLRWSCKSHVQNWHFYKDNFVSYNCYVKLRVVIEPETDKWVNRQVVGQSISRCNNLFIAFWLKYCPVHLSHACLISLYVSNLNTVDDPAI